MFFNRVRSMWGLLSPLSFFFSRNKNKNGELNSFLNDPLETANYSHTRSPILDSAGTVHPPLLYKGLRKFKEYHY